MNKEIAALWVKALRSGEYKQGQGRLARIIKNDNDNADETIEYCCLGILCDLGVKAGIGKWNSSALEGGYSFDAKNSNRAEGWFLHPAILAWADVHSSSGYISILSVPQVDLEGFNGGYHGFDGKNLAYLNDKLNYSFDQIADVIEKNVEVL